MASSNFLNNTESIRILSYNCRSIKNSVDAVKQLCNKHDIVLLQEHWLLPNDLTYLSSIHTDFIACGSSAVDVDSGILVGRPYGATAILFRRSLSASIRPVTCHNKRITAAILSAVVNACHSLFC